MMGRLSRIVSYLLLASAIFVTPAFAQSKKENTVIGFIWEYHAKKVVNGKPTGEELNGQLRVFNHEAFKGPKKVGYVVPNGPLESTLTINEWPNMNGTITMKKTGQNPPIWQGVFRKDDGTRWRMTVKFQKS